MATNPKNTFAGKGMTKASRRSHAQAQGRRKLYPYLRSEQYGTPVETHYKAHYDSLDKQGNEYVDTHGKFTESISSRKHPLGDMQHNEAYGRLNKNWSSLFSNNHGKTLHGYIREGKMRTSQAQRSAKDLFMISFGADPKSR